MLINSTLTTFTDSPPGCPLIGYQNLVTASNIVSGSAAAGFPITNAANPATHLYWKGGVITGSETIDVTLSGGSTVDYVGIAGHNLGTAGISINVADLGSSPGEFLLAASPVAITDDKPLIMRFAPRGYSALRISLTQHETVPPQIAVIYVGRLLVLERGIKVDVQHVPITYGRKTTVVNGMSESGNFLGRIVLSESRESTAEFFAFTPTFYRSSIDPFLDSAQEFPFFWAWAPATYPLETGYAWLVADAQPQVSPDHLRIALTLPMAGLA